jgi:hypothetical protein
MRAGLRAAGAVPAGGSAARRKTFEKRWRLALRTPPLTTIGVDITTALGMINPPSSS